MPVVLAVCLFVTLQLSSACSSDCAVADNRCEGAVAHVCRTVCDEWRTDCKLQRSQQDCAATGEVCAVGRDGFGEARAMCADPSRSECGSGDSQRCSDDGTRVLACGHGFWVQSRKCEAGVSTCRNRDGRVDCFDDKTTD